MGLRRGWVRMGRGSGEWVVKCLVCESNLGNGFEFSDQIRYTLDLSKLDAFEAYARTAVSIMDISCAPYTCSSYLDSQVEIGYPLLV